jgi:hypothetical protein
VNCDNKDLLRPLGPGPDGSVLVERHRPGHTTELAVVVPVVEGRPLAPGEELATTRARADGTREVVDSYVCGSAAPRGKPAQVATAGYRNGWDQTFNSRGGSA